MSLVAPIIFFIIFFASILTFQILAFIKEKLVFWILAFVSGIVSGIGSLLITSYCIAVVERLEGEVAAQVVGAADMLQTAQFMSVASIALALLFFGSLLVTGILLLGKKYLANRM